MLATGSSSSAFRPETQLHCTYHIIEESAAVAFSLFNAYQLLLSLFCISPIDIIVRRDAGLRLLWRDLEGGYVEMALLLAYGYLHCV
jgi:hypothetical protein